MTVLTPEQVLSKLNGTFGTSLEFSPDLSMYSEATRIYELGYATSIPDVAKGDTSTTVPSDSTTLPDVTNDITASSLIEAMQQNQANSNSHTARFSVVMDNQNKLLEEKNKLSATHINLVKEQIKLQSLGLAQNAKRNDILNNLVNSNAILKAEGLSKIDNLIQALVDKNMNPSVNVNNEVAVPNITNSISLDTTKLDASTQIISDTLTEIKNKDFTTTVNNSVNLDTSKLEESTGTISNAIDEIKKANITIAEVGELKKEEINFNKNGLSTLKDTEGNLIKPREVKAKINAEQYIEQKDINETTFDDIKDYVSEVIGGGLDDVSEVMGVDSGMNLDFNPMEFVFKMLEEDLEAELLKEQNAGVSNV